jgi:hypothetical protein
MHGRQRNETGKQTLRLPLGAAVKGNSESQNRRNPVILCLHVLATRRGGEDCHNFAHPYHSQGRLLFRKAAIRYIGGMRQAHPAH